MKKIKNIALFFCSTLLLLSGCMKGISSEDAENINSLDYGANYIVTGEEPAVIDESYNIEDTIESEDILLEPEIIENEDLILDAISEDLDNDGKIDNIKLLKVESDICVEIDGASYYIEGVYFGDRTSFEQSPVMTIIGDDDVMKGILVYYSILVNGAREGYYVGSILTYEKGEIKEIWNSFLENENISFEFIENQFLIAFQDYFLEANCSFDISEMNDTKFTNMLINREKLEEALEEENAPQIDAAEYIGFIGAENNSSDILLKNPIYFRKQSAYIATLYSIWSFSDGNIIPTRAFIVYKYSYEGLIMLEMLSSGSISESDFDEFLYMYAIDEEISKNDLLNILDEMVKKGILAEDEKTYYLRAN